MKKRTIFTLVLVTASMLFWIYFGISEGKEVGNTLIAAIVITAMSAIPISRIYLALTQRFYMHEERVESEKRLHAQRQADADIAYVQRRADAHADYVQRKADADAAYAQRRTDAHADAEEREHKARVQMLLRLNKDGESMEQTLARLSAREAEAEEALKNFLSGHTTEEVDALLKEKLR